VILNLENTDVIGSSKVLGIGLDHSAL